MQCAHNLLLEQLGKTPKLEAYPIQLCPESTMRNLFAQLVRFFQPAVAEDSHAARLMQAADDAAGHDQHQAQELRAAASAYLRVVR